MIWNFLFQGEEEGTEIEAITFSAEPEELEEEEVLLALELVEDESKWHWERKSGVLAVFSVPSVLRRYRKHFHIPVSCIHTIPQRRHAG